MILVTGHRGLIGSKIMHELKRQGKEVIGFDYGDKFPARESFDMIIHCAANCIIRDIIKDPQLMMENIDLTYVIMELARQNNCLKVVMFSSARLNHDVENPYTVSKQFNEHIVKAYKECYDIDYIIIRPETVWGPNDNPRRVIPRWIELAKKGDPILVYGDSKKELSPIHVYDFNEKFMSIIKNFDRNKNKDPITITGIPIKAKQIAEQIRDTFNSKSDIIFLDAEKAQPQVCNGESKNTIRVDKFERRMNNLCK